MNTKKLHQLRSFKSVIEGKNLSDSNLRILKQLHQNSHPYPNTQLWYPMDTEENLKRQPQAHQDAWAKKPPITYDLNSYGHRCGEITGEDPNSIVFLGCSMTFGIGAHKEDTWPYLVASRLNKTEYNLSVPGGSLDSAYRLYKQWQPIIKSPLTVIGIPPHSRVEKISEEDNHVNVNIKGIGHWVVEKEFAKKNMHRVNQYMKEDLCPVNIHVNFNRNLDAIKNIAKETNSKLLIIDYMALQRIVMMNEKGRDNSHAGPSWHANVAACTVEKIEQGNCFE